MAGDLGQGLWFAAVANADYEFDVNRDWPIIPTAVVLVLVLIFLVILFKFLRLWIQCVLTGTRIGILDMVRMRLLRLDYAMIVRQNIALAQAGVRVSSRELEAHALRKGDVPRVAAAVIAAHRAGMDLPWSTAAALDLEGRDVLGVVKASAKAQGDKDRGGPLSGRQRPGAPGTETIAVGEGGAVLLPARLCERFRITEGSLVIAEEREDGILIRLAPPPGEA